MKHPAEAELALSISGDAGFWRGLAIGGHLLRCEKCRRQAAALRRAKAELQRSARELPEGLDWGKLQAEMTANIRLGVAAGKIVAAPAEPDRPYAPWRVAAAVTSIAVLMLGGWLFYSPESSSGGDTEAAETIWGEDGEMLLHADSSRIQLEQDGRGLALLNTGGERVTLAVSMQGSVRAGYVDEETGEVTIHQIYAPLSDE
jgi:hypothetical protein